VLPSPSLMFTISANIAFCYCDDGIGWRVSIVTCYGAGVYRMPTHGLSGDRTLGCSVIDLTREIARAYDSP
jgi:hypothetical protein